MLKKPSILVLGDPGPVRHELLVRRDIETLWTTRAEEVAALLRHAQPDVCLMSSELPRAQVEAAIDLIAQSQTPCIMIAGQSGRVDPNIASRASAIVPSQRVDSILALVGLHTGLQFARDARASFEALVRAYIGDEEHVLETANVSESGVAIRKFPRVQLGTIVNLEIELKGATVVAEARVVRFGREAGADVAGLAFVRIARAQRERIRKLVEAARRESARPDVRVEELFGDLTADLGGAEALASTDLMRTSDLRTNELDADLELAHLATWILNQGWSAGTPEWLKRVASELTQIERQLLECEPNIPDWVMPALRMRICLARCRNTPPDHGDKTWDLDADGRPKLPTAVADEAYRTFVKLADRSEHEGDAIVTQIAKIRAALLRDLLAGGPRPRSGVVPDFAARSPEPKILIEDAVEDEIAVLDPDEDDRRGWARA